MKSSNAKVSTKAPKLLKYILFFLTLTTYYLLLTTNAHAQQPQPDVPCNQVRPAIPQVLENEFHSLRPYQASPCEKEATQTVIACGNDLIAQQKYKVTPSGAQSCSINSDGSQTCQFEVRDTVDVSITLPDAALPILGNTELVPNSQRDENQLSDAKRVNEYVSWYLNGTTGRAEEPYLNQKNESDVKKIIDFSGPIKKLLPKRVQNDKREEQINKESRERHNQIAGCTLLGIPVPCYDISIIEKVLLGPIGSRLLRDEHRLSDWIGQLPPKEENYKSFKDYWKDYERWRGKSCTPDFKIPVINKEIYLCFNNPTKPDFWANMFNYIPLSSTEDRKGKVLIDPNFTTTVQPSNEGVAVSEVSFDPSNTENIVYFPHTEEVKELASILQKTYTTKGSPGFSGAATRDELFSTTTHCDLTNVRWNPGDDIFGEYGNKPIAGKLSYKANFSCTFGSEGLDQDCYNSCTREEGSNCSQECTGIKACEKKVNVALSVYTKTPEINEIWERLVFGGQSIVKRIFPRDLAGNSQLLDLPGVTNAKYSSSATKTLAGEPDNNRSGEKAEIYVPHLGGIYEYFLKGMQTALRPKGYGEAAISGITTSQTSGEVNCDKNAPETSLSRTLDKNSLYDVASRWVSGQTGNHVLECYNDVVAKSRSKGINPAFALVIWLNESNASNSNLSVEDFGIHSSSVVGFNDQFNRFAELPSSYKGGSPECFGKKFNDMDAFLFKFRTGNCKFDDPVYGVQGREYIQAIRERWDWVTNCPFPSYPTDTSCP